jgi:hypothetical protein
MTLGRPLVSPEFAGCHLPADRRQRTGESYTAPAGGLGERSRAARLSDLALHHGLAPAVRHILIDGPFRFQVPDYIDERPTLVGRR